jgi:hypothetical protein
MVAKGKINQEDRAQQTTEISLPGHNWGDENNHNSSNGGPSGTTIFIYNRAVIYRFMCNHQWKPKFTNYGQTKKSHDMEHEPILLIGTDKMTLGYAYRKPFKIHLPENSNGKMGLLR